MLVLEESLGFTNDLIEIRTSAKKESMSKLETNISGWLNNPIFKRYRAEKIDFAIVVYVNANRYENQDCDNVAKIVLDAISNNPRNPKSIYLVENDRQVIRLLVYKMERTEGTGKMTDGVMLSFRLHDPTRQMILVKQEDVQTKAVAYRMKESDNVEVDATTREGGGKNIDLQIREQIGICKMSEVSK